MTIQRGFTLIEMAIVLVIVTILIGGLAMPLSAQIQARRIAETRQTLQEAREALLGYAMTHHVTAGTNHYLPCPDTTGDGHEDRVGTGCAGQSGLLPWVDLGIAPQDAWGNRLHYAVITQFADSGSGFSASSTLVPPDPIVICSTHTCDKLNPDVAGKVVFVLVSHGPNGWGANNINGTTLAAPTGLDEVENLNGNLIYISRSPTKPDAASGEFDDLTSWVALDYLIPRVCPTGSDCSP
ncbi:MAG: type II secretion system protein [Hydrogenophilales bacterium]|nr:type II secretion system protein [Hydrogenophilales bacterium]